MTETIFLTVGIEESIPSGSVQINVVSIEYNDSMGANSLKLHRRQELRKQVNPVDY